MIWESQNFLDDVVNTIKAHFVSFWLVRTTKEEGRNSNLQGNGKQGKINEKKIVMLNEICFHWKCCWASLSNYRVIYFQLIRDNALQSVWAALTLSPNERSSVSHLKRKKKVKEMKEQRKNLCTSNINVKTITLKTVNHSLARMLVEKLCCDWNSQRITNTHKNTLEDHSCGFVYTKLYLDILGFFILVVASTFPLL